ETVQRGVVEQVMGELRRERHADPRKVMRANRTSLTVAKRRGSIGIATRRRSDEARPRWAATFPFGPCCRHARAGKATHVTVLAAIRFAASSFLQASPLSPLAVRVAQALEVLAACCSEHVGTEQAHVMACSAKFARAEVRAHFGGCALVHLGGHQLFAAGRPRQKDLRIEAVAAVGDTEAAESILGA